MELRFPIRPRPESAQAKLALEWADVCFYIFCLMLIAVSLTVAIVMYGPGGARLGFGGGVGDRLNWRPGCTPRSLEAAVAASREFVEGVSAWQAGARRHRVAGSRARSTRTR